MGLAWAEWGRMGINPQDPCEHNRRQSCCKDCGGLLREHRRRKGTCKCKRKEC
jgi:hypothetical protein